MADRDTKDIETKNGSGEGQQLLNGQPIEGFKLFKRQELHGIHSKLVEKDLAVSIFYI
jgi:hypothetical protein